MELDRSAVQGVIYNRPVGPQLEAPTGRTRECGVLVAALDADGPGAVWLTGEAGIGKTTVWEWAVHRGQAQGRHVLVSRATPAEARLPWVGLADLMRPVDERVIAALPPPQARALRLVALQTDGGDEVLHERAVGTAFLGVLQALAATSPVLVALDDVQHLDPASLQAIAFALRRLGPVPVALLAAWRSGGDEAPGAILAPERASKLELGPLSLAALFELIRDRLGTALPRPLLLRVHEASGGNPMYALELARALEGRRVAPAPGAPLPVPTTLTGLIGARVATQPARVTFLLAQTTATWRLLVRDVDAPALDEAVQAELVLVDEGDGPATVRAAHPLLGAAAYDRLGATGARAVHARLAAIARDPAERARHLALAATEPSEAIARALDEGAATAVAAGVPAMAVELSRLGLTHSRDGPARLERLDRLADAQFRAGDSAGAMATQEEALAASPELVDRARRRVRLAEISTEVIGREAAIAHLRTAAEEAREGGDLAVVAEVLLTWAAIDDDISQAAPLSAQALEIIESLARPDPRVLSGALNQAAAAKFRAGQGLDHQMFARAIEIERSHPYRRLSDRADAAYAALLKYADELGPAKAMLEELLAEARAAADLTSIAYAIAHLVHIALWQGQTDLGRAYAEEHMEIAAQGGLASQLAQARYNLGLALAYQGELDRAREVLVGLRDDPGSSIWHRHRADGALGFVALSGDDAAMAVAHLDNWWAMLGAMHFGEPGYSRSHLDYVCALVATGRGDDALAVVEVLSAQAARSGRGSAAATADIGRALVAADRGRQAEAAAAVDRALRWYASSSLYFDHARALLLAGQVYRRAKAKAAAHAFIQQAADAFSSFPARAWQARAAAELARVNVRPSAPKGLTETEHRVAVLAASGLRNRDVAAQAFMSVKTVEANLGRVYRKLGVRSRAQLAALMADRD
jgi:DNA-binding CsgD family transcriptional regulator/tetratricopeptide (TPR) repeat protein